jgi:hypothetical protein
MEKSLVPPPKSATSTRCRPRARLANAYAAASGSNRTWSAGRPALAKAACNLVCANSSSGAAPANSIGLPTTSGQAASNSRADVASYRCSSNVPISASSVYVCANTLVSTNALLPRNDFIDCTSRAGPVRAM